MTSELDQIKINSDENYYFDAQVSFVCQDPKCKAAYCYTCMKDYIKYSATVHQTNEEAYRIWYNKNINRQLNIIKPGEFEEWTAPEYHGKGISHARWLEK